MKITINISLLFFLIGISCNQISEEKSIIDKKHESIKDTIIHQTREKHHSELTFDSLLNNDESHLDYLVSTTKKRVDTIDVVCNCEKDVKNNRLLIQIRKGFPAQSELNNHDFSGKGIIIEPDYPIQFTYLTISIKDSLVEAIEIHRLSQEPQFKKSMYKVSKSIKKYKIALSKNKYHIAQDIRGKFQFILPLDFGIKENDTIITGYFHCNNSQIKRFTENISYPPGQSFNVNADLTFQEKTKYNDDNVFEEIHPWECNCKVNSTEDTLFISNSHGDGLTGDQLTIKLTKKLNPNFIYETWTDCCSDYYLKYSFNKYQMVLNKNPFHTGTSNLIGTYWIASDTIPQLFGKRLIKKGIFICE